MKLARTERGFEILTHEVYQQKLRAGEEPVKARLVQASSIIGDYADALSRPGTSALWLGERHHLSREEVAELVRHLTAWLETGSMAREGS